MNEHAGDQHRISVFLVDDHEIFRRGIRALLALEPDIDVIGEAETASSALARLPALRPDVALLDVRLPDRDGISVCREIRSALPGTACLMLTGYGDDQALLGAIVAGAAGYVSKQTCGTDLVSALRKVAAGLSVLDPQASALVMARLRQRTSSVDPMAALTEQEKRVLELIGEGLTNRQIAERMFLAEKTAKNYVSSLLAKLGMQRRTQAAAFAVRHADNHDELIASKGALGPAGERTWPAGGDRRGSPPFRLFGSGRPSWFNGCLRLDRLDADVACLTVPACPWRAPRPPSGMPGLLPLASSGHSVWVRLVWRDWLQS